MSKHFRWIAFMAIISLLTACFGGEDRAAVAIRKFESIPLLSGSALITSVNGIGGGSSETCYGGYVDTLYGTSKSRSEVLAFYREQARIENWGINEKSSSDSSLFAGDDNAYALSVVIMMPVGPTELYYSPYIPKKDIDEAFGKFSTIYVLHISYYPNFKNC